LLLFNATRLRIFFRGARDGFFLQRALWTEVALLTPVEKNAARYAAKLLRLRSLRRAMSERFFAFKKRRVLERKADENR